MPEHDGIFEAYESDQPDVAEQFETFLNGLQGLTVADLDNIEIIMHIRLRSLLTVDQLHQRAHHLISLAEHTLQQPGSLRDAETGEPVSPILVENFPGGPQEVIDMIQSGHVQDNDITAFLEQFGDRNTEEE